jgi:prepilin-type N-terminal cleavage/methylation domain-containing protein/prepilin-type processing-associated H-X9-DG protein
LPRPARPVIATPARPHGGVRRAFTLLELLVVVAIIAIILAILLPVMSRARRASQTVTCVSNLRHLAVAFHVFADRNGKRLPDPMVTQVSWEASLLPYASQRLFHCPADGELFASIGSSYDWRDTPDPATTLAGKDPTNAGRSNLVLVFEALPGWHSKQKINAAFLDGSAREMDYEQCLQDLEKPNMTP